MVKIKRGLSLICADLRIFVLGLIAEIDEFKGQGSGWMP